MAHRRDDLDHRRARVILALETSCDDTCAAVVTTSGRIRVQRDLLAGDPRPLRRRRAGDRLAPPPRADRRRGRRRARRARAPRSPDVELVAVTRGPGLVAALLVGRRDAPRRWPPRTSCRSRRSTTCTGTSRPASSAPSAFEPPFLSLIASGGHTLLARVTDRGPGLRGARADARRRRRRGVRQGRAAARAGLSRRRRARAARPRRRPGGVRVPDRRASCRGLDFSFAGLKTALLYRVRELGEAETERRRADLAASYQRAIVESLAVRVERALPQTGLDRLAVGGGVAANGPLRERLGAARGRARRPAARAVHRQRGDDRQRRALRRRRCPIRTTWSSTSTPPASARRCRDDATRRPLRPRRAAACATTPARSCCGSAHARPFAFEERDIESDDSLLRAYLERIPVVTIDGVEAFELFVDEAELERSGSS